MVVNERTAALFLLAAHIWFCPCCCFLLLLLLLFLFLLLLLFLGIEGEHKMVMNERTAALFLLAAHIWFSSSLPGIKRLGDILLQILYWPAYCVSLLVVVKLWLLLLLFQLSASYTALISLNSDTHPPAFPSTYLPTYLTPIYPLRNNCKPIIIQIYSTIEAKFNNWNYLITYEARNVRHSCLVISPECWTSHQKWKIGISSWIPAIAKE